MSSTTVSPPRRPSVLAQAVRDARRYRFAYLFLLPAAAFLTVVNFVPMVQAVVTSMFEYSLFRPARTPFVGAENFVELVEEPLFWQALAQTGVYTVGAVLSQFGLGLAAALILNRSFRFRAVFRGLVLLPWVIPGALAGMMFALLFTSNGLVNTLARAVGLVDVGLVPANFPWLSEPATAMLVLIVTTAWKGFPFFAVMLLAAMQGVPQDLYEAARVDGASALRQFWHVTLPGIRLTILVALLLQTIWTFNTLDLIYIMTFGGPAHSTTTLVMLAYQEAFGLGQIGNASALSVLILLIVAAVSWLYLAVFRKVGAAR